MAKTCALCGKPSGMYFFCMTCNKLKADGKIEKCEKCGVWHYIEKSCKCENTLSKEESNVEQKETTDTALKCLTCGKNSDGQHFCKDCYYKYKNKSLLIKISECKDFDILDESYEGIYVCKDGHIVKSKSELLIDNYFYENKIRHIYEKKLKIDNHSLHPDFYLPDLDAYLEHWGFNEEKKDYTETKNFKINLYEKENLTIICTSEKDMKELDSDLEYKLKHFEKGKINFKN